MIEGFTKRDIVTGAIVLIVATALTIEGTYYVLYSYVSTGRTRSIGRAV
jgi:hypothetical protein